MEAADFPSSEPESVRSPQTPAHSTWVRCSLPSTYGPSTGHQVAMDGRSECQPRQGLADYPGLVTYLNFPICKMEITTPISKVATGSKGRRT